MTVYMVFEPPRRGGDPVRHAERIVFVRDRFAWGAFLLGPLWLLWRRLWLALVGYVVVIAALMAALWWLGAGFDARAGVVALIALLLGFEAATVRRWTLLRRGWLDLGTVIGDDREAAERRFFDGYLAAEIDRAILAAAPPAPPPDMPAVVGLFPEPGAAR